MSDPLLARSGRPADALSVAAVRAGALEIDDLRIHPDALCRQAEVAEALGNPQLGENFRRAAEMTQLDDEEVLALYEALRPHRSAPGQLIELAGSLAERGLPLCARLFEEAAAVYERRGLSA
jgi:propanediol dehydratase small subunit